MGVMYATRGAAARATDVKAAAYANESLDRAIATASEAVDRLCHRGAPDRGIPAFAPWTGTLTFDWPTSDQRDNWSLWLGAFGLQSLTSLTSGGTTISTDDVFLEPFVSGPPYHRLTLNRAGSSVFRYGDGVGQRSIAITGTWVTGGAWTARTGWDIPSGISSSATSIRVDAPVDVGHILRIDDERLIVTERSWVTSGQTGTLASATNAQSLAVSDGSAFFPGEEILLDAERMLIRDVAGNSLIVQRAVGGSTLAAHTGAAIYVSRTFTVERGALGTTAATHSADAAVSIWEPPRAVNQLTIAYATDMRAQESSGYARTIGSGEGERMAGGGAIRALEDRVRYAYGRNMRMRAV